MKIPRNPVWILFWISILIYTGTIEIFFPGMNKSFLNNMAVFTTVFACLCSIRITSGILKENRSQYANIYMAVYTTIICISATYTYVKGYASATAVFYNLRPYLSVFLFYPAVYLAYRYKKGLKFFDSLLLIVIITQIIRAGNCLLFEFSGQSFLENFIAIQVKNNHPTCVSNAFDHFIPIFAFFRFLNSDNIREKRRYLFYTIISAVFVIRFISSRMMILAVVCSLAIIWTVYKQYNNKVVSIVVIGCVAIAIFINTPYFDDLLSTVTSANSNDFSQGEYNNTASARLLYIETYNAKGAHSTLGMGIVSYGSTRYKEYLPLGAVEDLGYLGDYYTFGVLCFPLIGMLLFRSAYLVIKYFKSKYAQLLSALVVFLLITGITLSVFGTRKIYLLSILLAVQAISVISLNTESLEKRGKRWQVEIKNL